MNQKKPDLKDLRREIVRIDHELLSLFKGRMSLAREIAFLKARNGMAVFDPQREDDIVREAMRKVDPADAARAGTLLRSFIRLSRGVQYDIVLSAGAEFALGRKITEAPQSLEDIRQAVFQGTAGSYAELACERLFPRLPRDTAGTWEEACRRVVAGQAVLAVLPLDNSTAGTVDDVYDLLLRYDLQIWRSLSLQIRHCLLGLPGSTLDGIRTVISHPQALAQCSDIIRSRGWTVRESLNTAFAAESAAAANDPSLAAIASEAAAASAGLRVLASPVNNTHANQTRFIAVGSSLRVTPDADRVSLVLRLPHRSGSLASTLAVFGDRGLNLTKIQSRPDLDNPWSYLFYLDFECPPGDRQPAMAILYQLSQEMPMMRFLGWYKEEAQG